MIQDAVDILLCALIVAGCLYVIVDWCLGMDDLDRDDEWWSV